MQSAEKNKTGDQDSDDEELSEKEQINLENILILFPFRENLKSDQRVDDATFDRIKSALSCRICLEVYKDPVYTKDCMHRFCKQCIEKIIRSQQNKSCPFCRTPLGSRRVLKSDYITEQIINKIFPDLKVYLSMEEEQDKQYYSSKIRELQDNTKGRRKNKGGDSPPSSGLDLNRLLSSDGTRSERRGGRRKKVKEVKEVKVKDEEIDDAADLGDIGDKVVKKVKLNKRGEEPEKNLVDSNIPKKEEGVSSPVPAETSNSMLIEDIPKTKIEEIAGKPEINKIEEEEEKKVEMTDDYAAKLIKEAHGDETLLARLKLLMDRADLGEIIMSLDFLTPVIIEPLPSEPYLKRLDNPVIKTTSAIKVEQLAKFVCKKLNLNETKYNERIQLWIKKESKFELVDKQMKLKDISSKYWSHLERIDWEVYDLIAHVEEYFNKTTKPVQSGRVLYYSVYLDDWL